MLDWLRLLVAATVACGLLRHQREPARAPLWRRHDSLRARALPRAAAPRRARLSPSPGAASAAPRFSPRARAASGGRAAASTALAVTGRRFGGVTVALRARVPPTGGRGAAPAPSALGTARGLPVPAGLTGPAGSVGACNRAPAVPSRADRCGQVPAGPSTALGGQAKLVDSNGWLPSVHHVMVEFDVGLFMGAATRRRPTWGRPTTTALGVTACRLIHSGASATRNSGFAGRAGIHTVGDPTEAGGARRV